MCFFLYIENILKILCTILNRNLSETYFIDELFKFMYSNKPNGLNKFSS